MRRLLVRLAAVVGLVALFRRLRKEWERRRRKPTVPVDPAEALRVKLAEARAAGDERDEVEAGETRIDEAVDPGVEARRRSVHERARAAIDQMQPE